MKILLDTCVIIDFLQEGRNNHIDSMKAIIQSSQNGHDLYISANSVTDIHYLVKKELKSNKSANRIIDSLFDFVDILDTTKENIESAMKLDMHDFEDAVLVDIAVSNGMDLIVTSNIKDFKQNLIKVYTPRELLVNLN